VHPLSTALLILGYGLALPLAGRLPAIVSRQQRLAFSGHQLGILIALLGWLSRSSFTVAVAHAVWLLATRIWFALAAMRHRRQAAIVTATDQVVE